MKKIAFILISILSIASVKGQWQEITYFDSSVDDMKVFDGELHMVGNFIRNEGQSCLWSAIYDGDSIKRQTNNIGGGGLLKISPFNGMLVGVGSLNHGGFSVGVSEWDGNTWVDGGGTNKSHSVIHATGNDLYVGDDFGLIRKKTSNGSFSTFYDLGNTDEVDFIYSYKGDLIVAGDFMTIGGVSAQNIAAWDGTNWKSLGSGLNGRVLTMIEYDGDLYVGGDFDDAGGITVGNIAKWNGTAWSDVGGGVTGTSFNGVNDMVVFNNDLWVVGDFDEIGNVSSDDVASWDGTTWSDRGLVHNAFYIESIEVFENNVYIGAASFDTARVYRYGPKTGLDEVLKSNALSIYPNPVSSMLQINILAKNVQFPRIELLDMRGTVVKSIQLPYSTDNTLNINCEDLPAGFYFVKLHDQDAILGTKKLIIQ